MSEGEIEDTLSRHAYGDRDCGCPTEEGNYLSFRFILPMVKKEEKMMTQKDTYWRCPCFPKGRILT